jgi:hypothetical protein
MTDAAVMVEAKAGGRPPEGEWNLDDGIYAAFVSFYPRIPNAISLAARWLAEVYVAEVLDGRVLTDFDEQVRRFDDTIFSLEQVMGGRVSTTDARRLLGRLDIPPHQINQFIQRIETVNGDIRNQSISGSGNIVAGDGGAAAGTGGAAAVGASAAAAQGSTAKVRNSFPIGVLRERAKASRWAQTFGVLALIATVTATILVTLSVTDLGIAGYILAVIAVVVGVIPLFSK